MTTDIWPAPPREDTRCYCYHPEEAHQGGTCSWSSYGEVCNCHRYRNLAEIRRGRREDRFWAGVGGHDLYC